MYLHKRFVVDAFVLGEVKDTTVSLLRAKSSHNGDYPRAHGSDSRGGDRTDTSPTLQTSGQTSLQEGGREGGGQREVSEVAKSEKKGYKDELFYRFARDIAKFQGINHHAAHVQLFASGNSGSLTTVFCIS